MKFNTKESLQDNIHEQYATHPEYIDVTNYDVSNIEDMSSIFQSLTSVEQIIGLDTWDVSNAKTMKEMFCGCKSLISIDGIKNWNVSNVKDMNGIFASCKTLQEINLSKWDVSNVINMNGCFSFDKNLENIIGIENLDISNVKSMAYAFSECWSLKELDLSKWNFSNMIDMSFTFDDCRNLRNLNINEGTMNFNNLKGTGILYGTPIAPEFSELLIEIDDTINYQINDSIKYQNKNNLQKAFPTLNEKTIDVINNTILANMDNDFYKLDENKLIDVIHNIIIDNRENILENENVDLSSIVPDYNRILDNYSEDVWASVSEALSGANFPIEMYRDELKIYANKMIAGVFDYIGDLTINTIKEVAQQYSQTNDLENKNIETMKM